MIKSFIFIFIGLFIFAATACTDNTLHTNNSDAGNLPHAPTEPKIQEETSQENISEEVLNLETDATSEIHYKELYATLIQAYASLEQSGYTLYDKDILGHSTLAIHDGSSSYWYKPKLSYAFYDINGDGLEELLIGTDDGILIAIYTIQNNKPVPVIQAELRVGIYLLIDNFNNTVIKASWGHMGYAEEHFYILDENGELIKIDTFFTGHIINQDDEMVFTRSKYADGVFVDITEAEYIVLINNYGSPGYGVNDVGIRIPDIEWKNIIYQPVRKHKIQGKQ